jgi:hypothetical protein
MFGGSSPSPPSAPPPPPNPPTYASALATAPEGGPSLGRFGGFASSVLTGPMGTPARDTTQRKSLLGQ